MNEQEAVMYVKDHRDSKPISITDIEDCFQTLYGREPDDWDRSQGLWQLCVKAVDARHMFSLCPWCDQECEDGYVLGGRLLHPECYYALIKNEKLHCHF